MSDRALLNAVLAEPDDDTPRLVYADWLQENGDPDRAEFIRVQCELARLTEADPTRAGLEDREHELLEANEIAWLGDPVRYLTEWEWSRGFVSGVTANRLTLASLDAEFASAHPITHVTSLGQQLGDTGSYRDWAQASWTPTVQHIDCSGTYPDGGEFNVFLQHSHMPNWRGLNWSRVPGIAGIQHLFIHAPCRERTTRFAFGGRSGNEFEWANGHDETLDVPDFVRYMA